MCLKDGTSLEISYSSAGQDLSHRAYIDCLKEAQSAVLCLLPPSTLLIGTDEDGHVYKLCLDKRNQLQLICDIQQPVASIMVLPSDQVAVIGRYGKIVLELLAMVVPCLIRKLHYLLGVSEIEQFNHTSDV